MNSTHLAYQPASGWGSFDLHADLISRFESYCLIGARPGQWEFVSPTYQCTTYTLLTDSSVGCSVYWWEEHDGHISELVIELPTPYDRHSAAFAEWFEALRREFGLVEDTTSR